ncbi:DsrE/DsrF/DrsH-like family protein [Halodesulfurarchaeum sp.]|uniref:DsrE/DsrF/DrsH-like family protein n=1 Tax=Halodesulfurarchaeum sp. TaxID=1980530 RepID=UPI001BBECDF6|nr:DsrE/DsrF/DrsH-like family protein [Halodesulfurarchaeum sp.]
MTGYAVVLASEEFERVQAVSMIASVAASSDVPVEVFVTMNGLNPFETETVENMDFEGGRVADAMMSADTSSPLFTEQLEKAKAIGPLQVYACEMAMDVLGNDLEDYVDVFDDTLGVSGFLNRAKDKQIIFV